MLTNSSIYPVSGNLVFLETGKIGPIYQVPNSVSSNKYSQNFSSHFQIGSHNISLKGKSWDNLYFLDALASLRPCRPRIAIDNRLGHAVADPCGSCG